MLVETVDEYYQNSNQKGIMSTCHVFKPLGKTPEGMSLMMRKKNKRGKKKKLRYLFISSEQIFFEVLE